jgi:hypothetical protein
MKKQILKFTAFLLILSGIAASCNTDEYPQKISFTEFSLKESCQWKNLPYDEKVIIINSSKELEKYFSCTEGDYPAVDFAKHSLLIVSGYVNGSVAKKTVKDFKQVSSIKYILNMELDLKYKDNTEPWNMALIVEKINDDGSIKLNLMLNAPKIIRPVTITDYNIIRFFDMTLTVGYPTTSTCFFTDIPKEKDTCFIINSISELQQIYICTNDLPDIDFDRFTLIIGQHWVYFTGVCLIDQKIIEDDILTILIMKERVYDSGYDSAINRYHWGIYPKLPNKPLIVEYKYPE